METQKKVFPSLLLNSTLPCNKRQVDISKEKKKKEKNYRPVLPMNLDTKGPNTILTSNPHCSGGPSPWNKARKSYQNIKIGK